jgi:hypothetical protein
MSKARSGGGITMNKNVNVGVRVGSRRRDETGPANATQPGAIEYQGSRPLIRNTGPAPAPMGNDIARNVGGGGPGSGRTLYGACGTQGLHPNGNPNGRPKT